MRWCLAVLCFLLLFASPFLLAFVEAECLLALPDCAYRSFDPCLPIARILATALLPILIPSIVGLFGAEQRRLERETNRDNAPA